MILLSMGESAEKGDSFGQILLRALSWLNPRGQWFFFLPVSFLTVRRHAFVRKVVLSRSERLKVTLLGNIFPGVLSEAVLAEGRLRADGESEDSLPPRLCRPTVQPLSGEPYRVDVPAAPHYVIEAFASPREKELWQRLYRVEHRRLPGVVAEILQAQAVNLHRLRHSPFPGRTRCPRGGASSPAGGRALR